MFIFGWGSRQQLIAEGNFRCPVCQSDTPYSHVRQRTWFSLFFVPIIPISHAQDSILCKKCQTAIPSNAFPGQTSALAEPARVSHFALFGMLLGVLSLLTVCLFVVSLPLAIAAVSMGHAGLQAVQKNRPHVEGRWQAITALVSGYSALLLSITIGATVLLAPRWLPPNGSELPDSGELSGAQLDGDMIGFSDSTREALKGAEYEIASERDKPAGRGNSAEAIALASEFSERMKELSDEVFTSDRRPLLQLSDGEYLTFCELHEDRCLFLVHVPSYRNFTGDAKKALAQIAWAVAQSSVAGKFPAQSKLGVGLRGVLSYGDIMLGDCPESQDDEITPYRAGKKEDLLPFFDKGSSKDAASATLADNERAAEPDSTTDVPAKHDTTIGSPNIERTGDTVAAGTTALEKSLADVRINPLDKDLEASNVQPSAGEHRQPDAKPDNAMANPEIKRERRRSTWSDDFENQIAVSLVKKIQNEGWAFTSLAFSSNGKWLAGGKLDQTVYVFDTASGATVAKLERLDDFSQITALAFSASGDFLVAGGYSGQTACWKVAADGSLSDQESQFRFESEVELLITSPKFPFLMGASRKGTIVWQAFGPTKSQPRLLQEFQKNIRAIWLPASSNEALATDGLKLIRFSLRDGQIANSKDLGVKNSSFAAFSTSGKRLVVSSYDTLYLYDLAGSNGNQSVKLPRGEMLHSLGFHPNEHWIAVGMRGKIAIFDFEKAEMIAYADTESISYQTDLAFSADGKYLATSSQTAMDPIKIFQMPERP